MRNLSLFTYLSYYSFHSVCCTGTTTSNLVSLTAVVDALETQRRELGARNKELELQVRDLLLALKKQNNASSPSKASRREEAEDDDASRQKNRFVSVIYGITLYDNVTQTSYFSTQSAIHYDCDGSDNVFAVARATSRDRGAA